MLVLRKLHHVLAKVGQLQVGSTVVAVLVQQLRAVSGSQGI